MIHRPGVRSWHVMTWEGHPISFFPKDVPDFSGFPQKSFRMFQKHLYIIHIDRYSPWFSQVSIRSSYFLWNFQVFPCFSSRGTQPSSGSHLARRGGWGSSPKMAIRQWPRVKSAWLNQPVLESIWHLPSGNLTACYWKWWFIVDLPIENGDFP